MPFSPTVSLFSLFNLHLGSNLKEGEDESPCDKLGARSGYSFRNLVSRTCWKAPQAPATVTQQPCPSSCTSPSLLTFTVKATFYESVLHVLFILGLQPLSYPLGVFDYDTCGQLFGKLHAWYYLTWELSLQQPFAIMEI